MKPIQSHKILLTIAIVFVAFVAFAYGYMDRAIGLSADNIASLKERTRSEEALHSQGRALTSLYSDTQSDRQKLSKVIIPTEKVVDLIVAVEALGPASGSKVTITTINSADQDQDQISDQNHVVNMKVTALGSWSAVMKTLIMAENLPYAVSIDSVRLDVSDKHVWNLGFDLRAATYSGNNTH